MTIKDVINQLGDLKRYCKDFADKEDPLSPFATDVVALELAIKALSDMGNGKKLRRYKKMLARKCDRLTFGTNIGAGINNLDGASIMPSDIHHNMPRYYKAIVRAFDKLSKYEDLGEPSQLVKVVECGEENK